MSRALRLTREGAWVVAGQFAAVLGSLVAVKVLTNLLDPASYGAYALALTLASLVIQTLLGPLNNGATRFLAAARERGESAAYIAAVRGLLLIAIGVVAAGAASIIVVLSIAGWGNIVLLAVAALVFSGASGAAYIFNGLFNAARLRSLYAFFIGLEPWARVLCAAALILSFGASSFEAMAGQAAAAIIILLLQIGPIRRFGLFSAADQDRATQWRRQIVGYAWPFAFWGVFTWLQIASDRWALQAFGTTADVGVYAVLFQLGYYPVLIATGAVMEFIAPILYQRAGDASDRRRLDGAVSVARRAAAGALLLALAGFAVAALLHEFIFTLLAAPAYAHVSYLLPFLVLSSGLFSAGQSLTLALSSQLRSRALLAVKVGTSLCGVAFNVAGAAIAGTEGVVAGSLAFSLVYLVAMLIVSRHRAAA